MKKATITGIASTEDYCRFVLEKDQSLLRLLKRLFEGHPGMPYETVQELLYENYSYDKDPSDLKDRDVASLRDEVYHLKIPKDEGANLILDLVFGEKKTFIIAHGGEKTIASLKECVTENAEFGESK